MLSASYAVFIDVGFLRAEGLKVIGKPSSKMRLNARGIADWCRSLASLDLIEGRFIRAYWYDAAFHPAHKLAEAQRRVLFAIGKVPGIQLRLGHIAETKPKYEPLIRESLRKTASGLGVAPNKLITEFERHWTFKPEQKQKGVDTLLALDLVRLAGRRVCDVAVLISGDRDLAEAVRAAQDLGTQVLVATPNRRSVARELSDLADDIIDLDLETLTKMLHRR